MDRKTFMKNIYSKYWIKAREKEYKFLLKKMPKEVDWGKLAEYEVMDMTIGSQELACAAGGCEIQ